MEIKFRRTQDMIDMRVEFLKSFDNFVRDHIGDEDLIDYWLEYGVPDHADDESLFEIAFLDDCWKDICSAFAYVCRKAGLIDIDN